MVSMYRTKSMSVPCKYVLVAKQLQTSHSIAEASTEECAQPSPERGEVDADFWSLSARVG